jgi:hypothetical protein
LVGISPAWRFSELAFGGGPGKLAFFSDEIPTEATLEVLALASRIAALCASVLGANRSILRIVGWLGDFPVFLG